MPPRIALTTRSALRAVHRSHDLRRHRAALRGKLVRRAEAALDAGDDLLERASLVEGTRGGDVRVDARRSRLAAQLATGAPSSTRTHR